MQVRVIADGEDLSEATLVIGMLEGLQPLPGSEASLNDIDHDLLAALGFEGKAGQTMKIPHSEAKALLLVGLGDELDFESIRDASANAIRSITTLVAVSRLPATDVDGSTRAVVEGSLLGSYAFSNYKTEEANSKVEVLVLVDADIDEMTTAVVVCEATNLARDWVNTPAMDKSPDDLASQIAEEGSQAGLSTEIWDLERIRDERLGGVLGVAAGSDREPRVLTMTYAPDGATTHLALVGKGITFDSGGLSIKPVSSMMDMKDDMSGAAIAAAAAIGMARLGLNLRVTCITPLTDNAIGGNATRPGDVLRPLDGPTIEVLNTDAEGRLILADGLSLAKSLEPDLMIDIATLTGAARVALGDRIAAVFASDDDVSRRVLNAASRAGEHFWRMPLFKEYRKSIDSDVADIKNVSGSRYGGAIVAALFLSEYAGDGPWAHIDVAGPARSRETSGDQVKGASGVGVRTLVELARQLAD